MNKSEIAERAAREIAKLQHMGIERGLELREHKISKIVERAIAESQPNDYFSLRKHLNDYESIFYGPHMCPCGKEYVFRRALEQGGEMYRVANYEIHECPKVELGDGEPSSAPPEKCGEPAAPFIPRWGMSFACVLPKGHEGEHLQGGNCFKHGEYIGTNCPQWPNCAQTGDDMEETKEALKRCYHALWNAKFDIPEMIEAKRAAMKRAENVFKGWRSGAAQEVSPPSPTVVSVARSTHSIASGYTTVGGNSAITECGDTRELKAALTYEQGRLDQFLRMKKERPIDPVYWDMHEENRLRAEAERLLGEPTKE